jgi:hypothetical protein
MIESFKIKPKDYKERVDRIITLLSSDKESTKKGVNMLRDIILETEMLVGNIGKD